MPDWSEATGKLKGQAPVRPGKDARLRKKAGKLFYSVLAFLGSTFRWILVTILLSAGLTALLNESIRNMLWQALLPG